MTVDSKDLKILANQELDSTISEALAAKMPQYHDVIPEEVLDLLEEAVETYVIIAPTLSSYLRGVAKKEIEFFIRLYQDKIRNTLHIQNPQPPQKILQLLAGCGA